MLLEIVGQFLNSLIPRLTLNMAFYADGQLRSRDLLALRSEYLPFLPVPAEHIEILAFSCSCFDSVI